MFSGAKNGQKCIGVRGFLPHPTWRAYIAPPDPSAGLMETERGWIKEGEGKAEEERRGGEGEGRKETCPQVQLLDPSMCGGA